MSGTLHALLVGIDDYPEPVPRLAGCVTDVTVFADVLRQRIGSEDLDLLTVTDAEATRAAVTRHFSEHLGRAGAEDVALFYFSGHGSQQATPEELWSIEPDHRNETIVCFDSRQPGSWDVADKELAVLVAGVAASGCHVLVVLDCCHSGGGTRDADEVVRLAPADTRPRPAASFLDDVVAFAASPAAASTRAAGARWSLPSARHVLLAACRSSEKAKEVT